MRCIEFKTSFDGTYKKLATEDQLKVDEAIDELLDCLERGDMVRRLGLKRLQADEWEIRVDIRLRVGFRMSKNRIEFGIVGSHDAIKKFLKNL